MDTEWSKRLRQIGDSLPKSVPQLPKFATPPTPTNPFGPPDPSAPAVHDPFSPPAQSDPPATVSDFPFGPAGANPPAPYSSVAASRPAIWPTPNRADVAPDVATNRGSIPSTVRTAYLALMAAAALAVVMSAMGIYGLTELRDSTDKVLHLDPTGTALFYATDYVDNVQITLTVAAAVLGVLFALAYVLVGIAVKRGRSWPRPVGTVLAFLSLPALVMGPISIAAVIAGVVAVVACWMPGARAYAARTKAARGTFG